jgi:hypothetical protein
MKNIRDTRRGYCEASSESLKEMPRGKPANAMELLKFYSPPITIQLALNTFAKKRSERGDTHELARTCGFDVKPSGT